MLLLALVTAKLVYSRHYCHLERITYFCPLPLSVCPLDVYAFSAWGSCWSVWFDTLDKSNVLEAELS